MGGCFFVCGDRRPHPGSLCVITATEDLHSSPLHREGDERRERQGHVIAPLTERGGEEVRDTENRRTKGW